ncbi:hypothetical protein V6N13_018736 [Hibiscus sabdariffa]
MSFFAGGNAGSWTVAAGSLAREPCGHLQSLMYGPSSIWTRGNIKSGYAGGWTVTVVNLDTWQHQKQGGVDTDRIERYESLIQWRNRLDSARFSPVHLGSNAFKQAGMLLTMFAGRDGYNVEENNGRLMLGCHVSNNVKHLA